MGGNLAQKNRSLPAGRGRVRRLKAEVFGTSNHELQPSAFSLLFPPVSLVSPFPLVALNREIGIDRFPYGCYKGAQWLHSASI